MKKLLLSIILISFVFIGFAQRFNGGAMLGMTTTQVAGDSYSGFHKVGMGAGVFVNFQPVHHSSVQFEIQFLQKGSRKSANAVKDDYETYLLRLNYIEMPILYQYHFGLFYLEAGPSVAFFMSGFEEFNGADQKRDDFATATFQLNFGAGVTVAKNFKFGIRTNNSLTNLRSTNNTGDVRRIFPNNYGQFNDILLFSASYQFLHWGE